jgi:AcrR family transcriptional regulator
MSGMLVWSLPEPGRAQQPALGRDQIVRAAMKIADTEGVAAATMRRIATALGSSTPMSLYRYVGNKDGLVDLMLDAAIGEVAVPAEPTGDWRADLRGLALGSWAMMQRHPWYPELVHTRPPLGPQALARTEFGLAALTRTGLDPTTAMTYLGMVNGLTIGIALQANEELKMRRRTGLHTDDDLRSAARPFVEEIMAGGRYPTLNRWFADGSRLPDGDGFALVLDTLLDGIAARLGGD